MARAYIQPHLLPFENAPEYEGLIVLGWGIYVQGILRLMTERQPEYQYMPRQHPCDVSHHVHKFQWFCMVISVVSASLRVRILLKFPHLL